MVHAKQQYRSLSVPTLRCNVPTLNNGRKERFAFISTKLFHYHIFSSPCTGKAPHRHMSWVGKNTVQGLNENGKTAFGRLSLGGYGEIFQQMENWPGTNVVLFVHPLFLSCKRSTVNRWSATRLRQTIAWQKREHRVGTRPLKMRYILYNHSRHRDTMISEALAVGRKARSRKLSRRAEGNGSSLRRSPVLGSCFVEADRVFECHSFQNCQWLLQTLLSTLTSAMLNARDPWKKWNFNGRTAASRIDIN